MKDYELRDQITEEARAAIWQYFLDHSLIRKNGVWRILFFTTNEDDFWRRVQARFSGQFIRYKAEDKNIRQRAKFDALSFHPIEQQRWDKIVNYIREDGSLVNKLALFLYWKLRDYIKAVKH